jgi:hypothetical protein
MTESSRINKANLELVALTLAADFFYEHAAFSYDPKTETEEEGHTECARQLAAAEHTIQSDDTYRYEWGQTEGLTNADFEDTDNPYLLWQCVLFRGDEAMVSLSGIDLGRHGVPATENYRRVVEAELALEQIKNMVSEAAEMIRFDAYRSAAENQYYSDDIEIDAGAEVSEGEGGAFVQAWVWVSAEDAGLGEEDE